MMVLISILYISTIPLCLSIPPPATPALQFDIFHIKTPQLIGIICGCLVFTITISVVIYLLYASGTIKGFLEEMRGQTLHVGMSTSSKMPQIETLPRLHDYLLDARNTLPSKLTISSLQGKKIMLKTLMMDDIHIKLLFEACNGSPQYHESAYDPLLIWGWMDYDHDQFKEKKPWTSIEQYTQYLSSMNQHASQLMIIDVEMMKPIGMMSLLHNDAKNLTISIGNIWITPAYHRKKRAHESILMILQSLNSSGYRRITIAVDARAIIARKFIERCGFLLEAVLRKHMIVDERNRDTALYVMLNHEWEEKEVKLKRYLGWELRIKGKNAFAIPEPCDVISQLNKQVPSRTTSIDDKDIKIE